MGVLTFQNKVILSTLPSYFCKPFIFVQRIWPSSSDPCLLINLTYHCIAVFLIVKNMVAYLSLYQFSELRICWLVFHTPHCWVGWTCSGQQLRLEIERGVFKNFSHLLVAATPELFLPFAVSAPAISSSVPLAGISQLPCSWEKKNPVPYPARKAWTCLVRVYGIDVMKL